MKKQASSILYKLMILYMLKCSKSELTAADISDYILNKGYTDPLSLQTCISELTMEEMIIALPRHNRTYLELLPEGRSTIDSLESRIADGIRRDIYSYLQSNESLLNANHSIVTQTIKNDEDYTAILKAIDSGNELFSLSMNFPTENLAKSACDNFQKESTEIYNELIKRLMKS